MTEDPHDKIDVDESEPVPRQAFDKMYYEMRQQINELESRFSWLEDEVERLSEENSMLKQEVDGNRSGKYKHFCSIIDAADNKRDPGQEEIAVDHELVGSATGLSRSYRYRMMDKMEETLPFVTVLDPEEVPGHENKPKRLLIKFNGRTPKQLKDRLLIRLSQEREGEEML